MSNDSQEVVIRASEASALASAWTTGLLPAVLDGPTTARRAAERLQLQEHPTRLVLEVLAAMELIRKEGDSYGPRPDQLPFSAAQLAALFASLPDRLRGGPPAFVMDGELGDRARAYSDVVDFIGLEQQQAATELASRLSPVSHTLDIGAGSGVWGLAFARDGAELSVVDLPEVLPRFRRNAAALGVSANCIAGDYHAVELPKTDRVILANVLHLETEERAASLVERAAEAIRPGGELVIIEPTGSQGTERARARAAYALHLFLRTQHARAWDGEQIRQWMAAAGLGLADRLALGAPSYALEAWVGRDARSAPDPIRR